jgi:D-threonate/D-erythronate kinase
MIAVVADDFTGAAEIGAVGWQHGLRTVVTTDPRWDPDVDLVVIDTNSRSGTHEQARARVRQVAAAVAAARPDLVFKKTDSVLRGHVLAELDALLDGMGRKHAVIVPANPSLGRTMHEGVYYVGGEPLHLTSFSEDAEYPAWTSSVLDLLGADRERVRHAACPGEVVSAPAILVGDAVVDADMTCWAATVADDTIPAGGADFFAALLAARRLRPVKRANVAMTMYEARSGLYLVGSRTPESRLSINRLEEIGFIRSEAAAGTAGDRSDDEWADQLAAELTRCARVVVTAESLEQEGTANGDPRRLVRVAQKVLDRCPVQEVIVEGGSTASLLVRTLDWHTFAPVTELTRGIVRMEVLHHDDVHVTVKPGSYTWPAATATAGSLTAIL